MPGINVIVPFIQGVMNLLFEITLANPALFKPLIIASPALANQGFSDPGDRLQTGVAFRGISILRTVGTDFRASFSLLLIDWLQAVLSQGEQGIPKRDYWILSPWHKRFVRSYQTAFRVTGTPDVVAVGPNRFFGIIYIILFLNRCNLLNDLMRTTGKRELLTLDINSHGPSTSRGADFPLSN